MSRAEGRGEHVASASSTEGETPGASRDIAPLQHALERNQVIDGPGAVPDDAGQAHAGNGRAPHSGGGSANGNGHAPDKSGHVLDGEARHDGHSVPLRIRATVPLSGNGHVVARPGTESGLRLNGHAAGNGHAGVNGHGPGFARSAPNGAGIEHSDGAAALPLVRPRSSRYDRYAKPAIDWLGGLTMFLLFLPVMLVIAGAVWVMLGSPVLIRQRRIGRDGREFGMFKFRTMHPDRRRREEPVPPEADRRQTHKSADDPRHTPLGRLLRRMSLDELPQLLNVLAGHMSLVGPRPELADVVQRVYEPWQLQRHLVKPGITGLWQVTERFEGNGDMHHHTILDLAYIEQLSFRTDIRILVRTPVAVIWTKRTH